MHMSDEYLGQTIDLDTVITVCGLLSKLAKSALRAVHHYGRVTMIE